MPKVHPSRQRSRLAIVLAVLSLIGALVYLRLPASLSNPQPAQAASAGEWPMYGHDQSRTNYNPNETAISHSTINNLSQLWQANIGSNGVAPSGAPSIANGKVYVASSVAHGPDFFAFDAASGAQVWSASIGHIEVPCFNIGVGATPAVSGNVVVEGGGDAAYYGLDANTGTQLWRNPLNVGSSGFPWSSPLIVGNRAYVGVASRCDDPSVRGELRALDLNTGAMQANVYFAPAGVAGAGIWQSPALTPDGGTLVIDTGEDFRGANGPYTRAMVTLDPGTLKILQSHQQGATDQDLDFGTSPVIFHDSSGRLLTGANHKNGVFYAYVLSNVSNGPLWTRDTGTSVGLMPAYDPTFGDGGTLFIGANEKVYAVDPATGKDRWAPVTVGTMHGNMAIANGLIFANTGSSGLQILDEATGANLRTLDPPHAGSANSGPAVANGAVYWLSGSYVNAWGLPASGPAATPTSGSGSATGFADPAFSTLWNRTDSLVANHSSTRSWLWGPVPDTKGMMEPYAEGKGGQRLVQYFDKSRMEINNPDADPSGPFYVTNGLLVVELISGRIQVGNSSYQNSQPADINVAGDTNDPNAPTYKTFQGVANTTLGDHKTTDQTGKSATATLKRDGTVGNDPSKTKYSGIDFVHYEPGVGHNIPSVFWNFLNQQGPVLENGQVVQAPISTPWFYASGLPISEPYWVSVLINGKPTDVLMQAFERRVLTYTPSNADPFKVEMGNVGQHYYIWRYGSKK